MKLSDNIIILHYTPFSEKSVILHTLSEHWGRRSFLVKNASRCMAFFQPLSILSCEVAENPKSKLYSASTFCEEQSVAGIRESMGKNAISMFLAEVLYRSLREDAEEPGLFEWCRQEIALLNDLDSDYSNYHIRFLLDFASAMGFEPSFDALLPFLDDTSVAVTRQPVASVDSQGNGNAESVSRQPVAAVARQLLESSFSDAMLVPMSGAMRSALCLRLLKYLEYHIDAPLKIRSLAILSELF